MDNSFIWKTDRPWPNPRLSTAAIVGHTTSTTTKLWFRTASLGDFTLIVYPLADMNIDEFHSSLKSVPFTIIDNLPPEVITYNFSVENYDKDTTHVEEISGLTALTEYGYALVAKGSEAVRVILGHDRKMFFRTQPTAANSMSFAYYSCHMPYKHSIFGNTSLENIDMWDFFNEALERHYENDLRFVIGGGDQVYTDGVSSLDIWSFLNKVMRKEDNNLLPSKESMISWYRDIYRGYWGFQSLKKVFSSYPTYMIWDDHEIGDGWGSHFLNNGNDDELNKILPDWKEKGLSREEVLDLIDDMEEASVQVYDEYQHSHNPTSAESGQHDYHYIVDKSAFYVLDGRGCRDINSNENRILGGEQLERFKVWSESLDLTKTPYVFIVSAVPVVHLCSVIANADENVLAELAHIQDDLRDSWEHSLHDEERRKLLAILFKTANKGFKVSILSGDVHTAAAFRLKDDATGKIIYQLTSSAITYNKPRLLSWVLGKAVADEGHSDDGFTFERLALYTDSNFSFVKVDHKEDRVLFQLYGKQIVSDPFGEEDIPMTHSIAKLELVF